MSNDAYTTLKNVKLFHYLVALIFVAKALERLCSYEKCKNIELQHVSKKYNIAIFSTENPVQNILRKIKKSSKLWKDG